MSVPKVSVPVMSFFHNQTMQLLDSQTRVHLGFIHLIFHGSGTLTICYCLVQIAVAENESASLKTESSIESKSLLFALYDVFLGLDAVSPSAKASVAEGITKLL